MLLIRLVSNALLGYFASRVTCCTWKQCKKFTMGIANCNRIKQVAWPLRAILMKNLVGLLSFEAQPNQISSYRDLEL